jgi:sterol desaturase/sphingolipid hydroxylase (fatty acid hydroxylase superfamily)
MDWLLAQMPAALVICTLTLLERRRNPAATDWLRNLQAWGLGTLAALTVLPLFALHGLPSLLDGAALPFWLACPLFIVARDLGEFLFHRAQHAVPFMWAMHSLHHSDPDMSALTTQRHFWGDAVLKSLTIWPMAAAIVSPTPAIFAVTSFVGLWNLFVHARLDVNFDSLSWLVNSPAYHRRHHSSLPEHYNSNYAALFPIFDVICGSYHQPEGFPPTGLDRKPESLADVAVWPLRYEAAENAAPATA